MAKCGECLFNDQEVVTLDVNGRCPRCGADYGPEHGTPPDPPAPPVRDDGGDLRDDDGK